MDPRCPAFLPCALAVALASAGALAAVGTNEPSDEGVAVRPKAAPRPAKTAAKPAAPAVLTGAALDRAIEADTAKAAEMEPEDGMAILRADIDRLAAASRVRGRDAPSAEQIARLEQRIRKAVEKLFDRHLAFGLDSLGTRPADPTVRQALERTARLNAYIVRYEAEKLGGVPFLADTARRYVARADALRRTAPPPDPRYPRAVLGHTETPEELGRSATVAHADFREKWLPLATAFAAARWKSFPQVEDARGLPVTREHVIRAVIMQESEGVHRSQRGNLTQHHNTDGSTDIGFGQINDRAHRGISVNVNALAAEINDPAWNSARIGTILGIPKARWGKNVALDLTNPSHNMVAMVIVLGYAMERDYPRTATPEELLVKRLSGYNHGFASSDYNEPWPSFVARVDPRAGNAGEISGVHYGIQMKTYLGLPLTAREIDWEQRLRRRGLRELFYLHIDPNHAHAHFPLEPQR